MALNASRLLETRRSLIERLTNLADHAKWQEFFDTYWRLIYGVARRAGLNDAEAQDVVQDTLIGVARNIERYDAQAGSFRQWLLQGTRWRIIDQLRKRTPARSPRPAADGTRRGTATVERVVDPAAIDASWEEEWKRTLFDTAMERLKHKVNAKHFQVFDCAVRKHWSVAKISATLKMNVARVYLIKHRCARLLKKEIAELDRER